MFFTAGGISVYSAVPSAHHAILDSLPAGTSYESLRTADAFGCLCCSIDEGVEVKLVSMSGCICTYIYMYNKYIYIYMYNTYIYIYIYIHIYNIYICIYMYIYI